LVIEVLVGQQRLADRGAVGGQVGADARERRRRVGRCQLLEVDDVELSQHRERDGLAGPALQRHEVGDRLIAHVGRRGRRTQLQQTKPELVAGAVVLEGAELDESCEQPVDGRLRQAGGACQLAQRHDPFVLVERVEHVERLGQDRGRLLGEASRIGIRH
jgi:hypothetical protein